MFYSIFWHCNVFNNFLNFFLLRSQRNLIQNHYFIFKYSNFWTNYAPRLTWIQITEGMKQTKAILNIYINVELMILAKHSSKHTQSLNNRCSLPSSMLLFCLSRNLTKKLTCISIQMYRYVCIQIANAMIGKMNWLWYSNCELEFSWYLIIFDFIRLIDKYHRLKIMLQLWNAVWTITFHSN